MGLSSNFVRDLCDLKVKGVLEGASNVIEVGAQQLSNALLRSSEETSRLFELFVRTPIDLGQPIDAGFNYGIEYQSEENPSSRSLWEALGLSYSSIEFDGLRNSIPLDLNRDKVPRRLRGYFDLVVNTGTTEHVANQDNAFRVMHDLCKHGGVMYHELPGGGMMTHGLITYTPKFFWHLCRENDYEVIFLRVAGFAPNPVAANVRESNRMFSGYDMISPDLAVPDFMVTAALRKKHDKDFVTPLDIPIDAPKPASFKRRISGLFGF
jgi:SAM-dependent methyltransferase